MNDQNENTFSAKQFLRHYFDHFVFAVVVVDILDVVYVVFVHAVAFITVVTFVPAITIGFKESNVCII